MAVQRFMYLNDLSGVDYYACMHFSPGSRRSPSALEQSSSTRWEISSFPTGPLVEEFHKDLIAGRATAGYSYLQQPANVERVIRYCPVCLDHCFHWKYFQSPSVLRCPLHDETLLCNCKFCGAPLGTGLFVPNRMLRPLECPACHRPFIKRQLGWHATLGFPEAEEVFTEATAQFDRMLQVQVVDPQHHYEFNFNSDAVAKLYFNCLFKTANPEKPHPTWLFGMDTSVHEPVRPSPKKASDERETVEDKLRELICVYKSVGRHLAKQVHEICGHRRRTQLLFSYESIPFSGNAYYLLMRDDDCP